MILSVSESGSAPEKWTLSACCTDTDTVSVCKENPHNRNLHKKRTHCSKKGEKSIWLFTMVQNAWLFLYFELSFQKSFCSFCTWINILKWNSYYLISFIQFHIAHSYGSATLYGRHSLTWKKDFLNRNDRCLNYQYEIHTK